MEADQEAVLTSMGEELDEACRSLARNGEDKLEVFYSIWLCLMLCFNVLFLSALVCLWCAVMLLSTPKIVRNHTY